MPGANPLYIAPIIKAYTEQQTALAKLSTDQQGAQKTAADARAGMIESIRNADPAYKPQLWNDFLNQQFQSGRINKDQYRQYANNVPSDNALATLRDQNLYYSEQVDLAAKQGTAALGIARANEFKSQAAARDLTDHAQVAVATMPQDPAQVQDWLSKQPADVQHVLNMAGNPTDPRLMRTILTATAVPLTQQQKVAQEQQNNLIQEGSNIAARGDQTAYAEWLGGLKYTNPSLAAQMPPASQYDPKTYPTLVAQVGQTPEQRMQSANQTVERTDQEKRLGIEYARLGIERQKLDQSLGTGPLARGQGENLVRAYETIQNKADQMRDQLGQAITKGTGYVDEHGVYKPWSIIKSNGASDDDIDGYKQDMLSRYKAQTEDSLQAIADKNRIYGRMGASPQMSTEDAQNAIITGARQVPGMQNYRQAQAAPAPTGLNQARGSGANASSQNPQTDTPANPNPNPQAGTNVEPGTPRPHRQTGNPPGQIDLSKLQNWANQNPGRRAFNRQTGQALEYNGSQWVPAQPQ
jgi:hypothetical protein